MKVLLATDGSEPARATANLLYRLLPDDAEVVLLSVSEESELPTDDWAPGALAQLRTVLRDQTDRLLAKEASRLEEAGREVEVMTRHGDAGDQITRVANELQVDLVAVGSRGKSSFREYLLGSVSQRVAKHSPCSVLLGRALPTPPDESEGTLKVVLALDGSPESKVAARSLARLAPGRSLEVDCLRILPAERDWGIDLARHMAEATHRDKQQAVQLLRQTAAMLQAAGASASSHLRTGEDVAEEIIEHVRSQNAQLLVLGSKGMSAIDHFLLGSVTHKLSHHAPSPLLLVKGSGLA